MTYLADHPLVLLEVQVVGLVLGCDLVANGALVASDIVRFWVDNLLGVLQGAGPVGKELLPLWGVCGYARHALT